MHSAASERTFDPAEYLKTYYSTPSPAEDELLNLEFLIRSLREIPAGSIARALEVGCGPTIHHAIPLVPFARSVCLSDYSPESLGAVQAWLDRSPGAHDWSVYLAASLRLEGLDPTAAEVERRAEELRSRVTLRRIDLHQPEPLGGPEAFDLVTCFYTAECIARDRAHWCEIMRHLASLVAPGGWLVQAVLKDCTAYQVGDRRIPTVAIHEADLAEVLPACGFDPAQTRIDPTPIDQWADHGFRGIVMVQARKREGT